MKAEEMDNMFETLYNNIGSNQAPGLNAYEKSVFLTKAQDEILKNYFNPKSKGNTLQEGFDGNQKRQIDFSMLTTVKIITQDSSLIGGGVKPDNPTLSTEESAKTENQSTDKEESSVNEFKEPLFDTRSNSKSVELPSRIMMIINEMVEVIRDVGTDNATKQLLQVVPIKFDDYSRLMSKPYKRPLKYQAWRLINSSEGNRADLIIGPTDSLLKYTIRYIRRPLPIIVSYLDGLSIETLGNTQDCELDEILHEEIVQRAVELAKATWTSTGQDNIQAMMQVGQRSE